MIKAKIVLIVYLFSLGIFSCQEKSDPGLVVSYPFNGDSRDQSDNKNHSVVDGPVLATDRFGQENSAFRFDGKNDVIAADVSGMPAVEAPQSVSLWFRIDTLPSFKHDLDAHNMIALVDTNQGVGVQFGFRAPGYKSLGFDVWYWGGRTIMESAIPAINTWHHSVYIFDGKQHMFYLNGEKVAESTAQPQTGMPDMLMLGNYPGGDQYFAGSMDDVRIYNRKLSQSEINRLFTSSTKPDMRE